MEYKFPRLFYMEQAEIAEKKYWWMDLVALKPHLTPKLMKQYRSFALKTFELFSILFGGFLVILRGAGIWLSFFAGTTRIYTKKSLHFATDRFEHRPVTFGLT